MYAFFENTILVEYAAFYFTKINDFHLKLISVVTYFLYSFGREIVLRVALQMERNLIKQHLFN